VPLPVIADVWRVTFNWTRAFGVQPRNVIHVNRTSLGASTEEEVGTAILAAYPANLHAPIRVEHVLASLTVLALDGSSAGVDVPGTGQTGGEGSGDVIPNMCAIVSMRTAQRGPRGRGRQYVGPIVETVQNDGSLDGTIRANMLTAWEDFQSNLEAGDPPLSLCIASYKHADFHSVTNITVDPIVGTQRRRLAQLR
jgi:hypothetical protein